MSASLRTGFASAGDSPGLLLWQVTNAWQAAQRAALAPCDLTHVQFVLLTSLAWLRDDASPVTQRRLAEHARTDPMMTSQVLRALEAKGLVTRGAHPTDARARALQVTPAGQELADRAVAVVEDVDRSFFGVLDAGAATFTELLTRLADRGQSDLDLSILVEGAEAPAGAGAG